MKPSLWNNHFRPKVILLGNSGTGKTSILHFQLFGMSETELPSTIGCQYNDVKIELPNEDDKTHQQTDDLNSDLAEDKQIVVLKVWDTAGQEVYRSIVPVYIRDSSAAILVFDVTDKKSFEDIDQWKTLLVNSQMDTEYTTDVNSEKSPVQLYLVGNKIDKDNSKHLITDEQAEECAQRIGAKYFSVSAIKGIGVSELFLEIAKDLKSLMKNETKKTFIQTEPDEQRNESKGCC